MEGTFIIFCLGKIQHEIEIKNVYNCFVKIIIFLFFILRTAVKTIQLDNYVRYKW